MFQDVISAVGLVIELLTTQMGLEWYKALVNMFIPSHFGITVFSHIPVDLEFMWGQDNHLLFDVEGKAHIVTMTNCVHSLAFSFLISRSSHRVLN